jgi:hypothetical protein
MMTRVLGAIALSAVCMTVALADELKSGLAVGDVPSAFHPLNVTGEKAGKKNCLVCGYGGDPVAAIFARKNSDALTSLVKKVDAKGKVGLKSFVCYLSDDEALEDQLKAYAGKLGLETTVLAIDNVAGPKAWRISRDAEVTVILYNNYKVEANHAFKAGELNSGAVEKVVADIPKVLEK